MSIRALQRTSSAWNPFETRLSALMSRVRSGAVKAPLTDAWTPALPEAFWPASPRGTDISPTSRSTFPVTVMVRGSNPGISSRKAPVPTMPGPSRVRPVSVRCFFSNSAPALNCNVAGPDIRGRIRSWAVTSRSAWADICPGIAPVPWSRTRAETLPAGIFFPNSEASSDRLSGLKKKL